MASRPRIVSVLGTRPEIIKCSPVLPRFDAEFEHILIHTGQHYDAGMDDWFFRDLDLRRPDFNLAVGSGSHGAQLARMFTGIEPILQEFQPHAVFVQGDTNSTLAGGLSAAKLGLPVVHLEAGCRSFNRSMPEETNRVVVDHLAALCLAPDETALANLQREGIGGTSARLVGSTGIDACLRIAERIDSSSPGPDAGYAEGEFLVATIHRAENTTPDVLAGLLDALAELADTWPVLFPVHPRTLHTLETVGRRPGITYLDPVSYPAMVRMLRRCRALLTDSGGLQEEAAVLGTPAFILRNETEWVEFIESGRHLLVGTQPETIVHTVRRTLDGGTTEARMRVPAGTERAGATERMLLALQGFFETQRKEDQWNQPVSRSHAVCPGGGSAAGAPAQAKAAAR